MASLPPANVAG